MTDSEFLEMSRLLDSLTKGADTLRVVFSKETVEDKELAIITGGVLTTRDVPTDKAKAHPDFKRKYYLLPDRKINALVALINGCNDWTSDKYKASALYQKMRAFLSATSNMPKGVSGIYKVARSKCLELMYLIPGIYPDLYPPKVRELLADKYYQQAVDDGRISPPFTWHGKISDLRTFIDNTIELRKPAIDQVEGKEGHRQWRIFECIFNINGEPVTAKQLRDA